MVTKRIPFAMQTGNQIDENAGAPSGGSRGDIAGFGSEAACESNAALAARFIAREAEAFALLVERYHDFVFRICFGILRHRQDAEDATQETFSRMARHLDRWDRTRPLEPWLATVAGNRCRSQLARRKSFSPLTSVSEPQSLDLVQDQAADQMREEIRLAMDHLPDRQRNAFEMFHEQALSYGEIATRMDCPLGTVKTLVHRARSSIIENLRRREVLSERPSTVGSASEC